jgi:hypothetical protein
VLRAINSGGLPAERFGERGWWVIDEADLQAFVVKSGKDAGSAAVSNRGEATLGPCG